MELEVRKAISYEIDNTVPSKSWMRSMKLQKKQGVHQLLVCAHCAAHQYTVQQYTTTMYKKCQLVLQLSHCPILGYANQSAWP